ncbi:putative Transposase-associated domain-containing protein [Rosa chinensis]|uniref:Putative Transposase-associated domain-containing protein n=1 Tax=Rosa chinensis TaxID=74649 RepID=A0A2P6QWG0_ROSCH|nr:putative Transposase-associated domain-containing protein [Rosa chinensis]
MDRSWIQLPTRGRREYINGVKQFMNFAIAHMKPGSDLIPCPCMDCNNFRKYSPDQVEDHLYANGMAKDYTKWTDHGENDDDFELEDDILESENEEDVDDVVEMLNDFQAHDDRESQEHVPIMEENKFRRLMRDAEQELYPGCRKFSKLSFTVKLLHLKIIFVVATSSFQRCLS